MNNPIFSCEELSKNYHEGTSSIAVLKGIDFTIQPGERIAIVGPSGSGKSTLLHLLGGLDKPSSGKIFLQGMDWQTMSEKKRCQLRNQYLGFIYQFHHLLPEFTALENVAMPLLLQKESIKTAREKALSILNDVGLGERVTHKPSQLSGGERQRVAIARALIHEPYCVLADEPTGNLDNTTATKVFEMMLALNAERKTALVIVTHDLQLAGRMDKLFTIQDGLLSL